MTRKRLQTPKSLEVHLLITLLDKLALPLRAQAGEEFLKDVDWLLHRGHLVGLHVLLHLPS